jgi:hypothetical protein
VCVNVGGKTVAERRIEYLGSGDRGSYEDENSLDAHCGVGEFNACIEEMDE